MTAYPGTPNFRTGGRGDAHWKYVYGNGQRVACASQGLSVIKGCQDFLKNIQTDIQTTDVFGAHVANTSALVVDGVFGPQSCKCLYAYLQHAGVAAEFLAPIEADFNRYNTTNSLGVDVSRPGADLSLGTLRAIVWAAAHHDGDISRVQINSASIAPNWGVAPAPDGAAAGTKTCWNYETDPVPEAAGGTGVIQVHDGDVPDTTPIGAQTAAGAAASGLSTGAIVGIAAASVVVLGGAAALAMSSKPKRRRKRLGKGR